MVKVDIVVASVVVVVVVRVEARFIEGHSGPLSKKKNTLEAHTAGLAGGSVNHFT